MEDLVDMVGVDGHVAVVFPENEFVVGEVSAVAKGDTDSVEPRRVETSCEVEKEGFVLGRLVDEEAGKCVDGDESVSVPDGIGGLECR